MIDGIETLQEYAAYEEMLRTDCTMMMGEWGLDKVTDLTGLMNKKLQELK